MKKIDILKLAKYNNDLDLLYDFTKIVAESDSIGEMYGYCSEYTKSMFNDDINHIVHNTGGGSGYVEFSGLKIYARHLGINDEDMADWKIKYRKGDLVRDAEDDFDVIGHGCNCYCTMGAGIALAVKNKWLEAYEADKASAFADKGKLGTYTQWSNEDITVLNMYTQWDYRGKDVRADYDAIRGVMKSLKSEYPNKKIGLPLIGAGLAGGDWNVIEQIINEELEDMDVTIVIWENSREQWQLDLLDK